MAVTANIKGSAFNEGGGVTFTNNTGVFDKGQLVSGGINQATMVLPGDGERHHVDGITASLSVGATTAELVAAVAGREIEVLSYTFITDTATTVTWKSDSNAISGAMTMSGNGGIAQSGTDDGSLLSTNSGEALKITNSAGNINGHFTYRII
jgi:hypothetical protein